MTPFLHQAELALEPGGDERAPGAAITVALCGAWDHDPPCPLAPHHVRADRDDDVVRLRVLFACAAGVEAEVRRRIDAALTAGLLVGPDGVPTRWRVLGCGPGETAPAERRHAARLTAVP